MSTVNITPFGLKTTNRDQINRFYQQHETNRGTYQHSYIAIAVPIYPEMPKNISEWAKYANKKHSWGNSCPILQPISDRMTKNPP